MAGDPNGAPPGALTPIPSELAFSIAHASGGRVVLVVGAGVSVEPPTGLPLARQCALEANRQLVDDGVLATGRCATPDDLSAVADAVYEDTGSQYELVRRLPRERFISAQPNEGHLLAAALLRERAIASVLTLNFDLAVSSALTLVGAAEDVAQIRGPEDTGDLGSHNLIYLHRTAQHEADQWILRTESLEAAWTDAWEQAMVHRVLVAPVVVFAGLGSPAAVLTETAQRLRGILGEGVNIFFVDPARREDSAFFAALGLADEDYLQLGWVEFMRRLAARVAHEQVVRLESECASLESTNGWEHEDVAILCHKLDEAGLLAVGGLRARWMLEHSSYLPSHSCEPAHVADLLLSVRGLERETETTALLDADGVVEYWRDDQLRAAVAFVSARGKWRWGAIEPRVDECRSYWRTRYGKVSHVVVGAAVGPSPTEQSPPTSIVASVPENDIVRSSSILRFVTTDELRMDPSLAEAVIGV
jgi:hypothetical protein